jgi:hypothetical protein
MLEAPLPAQVHVELYLHVRVLISMILGLSVTRLLGGVAGIIQHPERHLIWPIHLGWVAWALLNVIASGGGSFASAWSRIGRFCSIYLSSYIYPCIIS